MTLARVRDGLSAVALCAAALSGQSASKTRPLSYTKFTLPNGLVTIVNEDHSSPIFGIDVMYHVGSKDEPPGHQQMAHMCEHFMYERSEHVPQDSKAFTSSLGGGTNGATEDDKTDFFGTFPSGAIEAVLWYEADKMAAPAFRSDSEGFAIVRSTVADERRRLLTLLYGGDHDALLRALYPKNHPYSWGSGDPLPSIETTPAPEVHAFCKAHYVPSNAVLAISGDVNPAQVRAWVTKYFGPIPRGSAPKTVVPHVTLTAEKRIVQEDARARSPALRLGWIGVGYDSPDKMPLVALAYALAGDRRSGLEKALVYDHKLATRVRADHFDEEHSGEFIVGIDALPTASLTAIEQVVDSVVGELRNKPVLPNLLADFRGFARMTATLGLERRLSRGDTLAEGQGFGHGDPVHYAKELDQANALTPRDVQRVARQYLTSGRVVLSLIPAGKFDMISKPNLPYTRVDGDGFPIATAPSERHENKAR